MNIKYEKGIYQAKITELEGYHSQLGTHLTNLETFKSQIFNFWEDERARKTARILVEEIRDVKKIMTQTSVSITNLKNIVGKLGAVEAKEDQELDNTFRALEVAAEFIP